MAKVGDTMKYRKKPVVIEAVQYFEGETSITDIKKGLGLFHSDLLPLRFNDYGAYIETLEGNVQVTNGGYIIKGIKGEFYPCKPDIFKATYEEVGE
jgi:hypothetical protein